VTFAAILLGLLAPAAFSVPALARHSEVRATSSCDRGNDRLRVDYTVWASQPGHPGTADLFYAVAGGRSRPLGQASFTARRDTVGGSLLLPVPPNQGKLLTLTAIIHWPNRDDAINSATIRLAHCRRYPPAPSTTLPLGNLNFVPRTSIQTVVVTQVLPFTGASSGPLLLAAVSLLGAGAAILVASGSRRRA
jgi:hypothetical protein